MENARLIFRNFTGKEGPFNEPGDRNFCVLLDDDTAKNLIAEGWKVKQLKPSPDGDLGEFYLPVALKYRDRKGNPVNAPKVMMVTSEGKSELEEDLVDTLDHIEIDKVDLIVRPYVWEMRGETGIKSYLKSIYVILKEDELDYKYRDIPTVGSRPQQQAIGTGKEDVWEGEVVYDSQEDDLRKEIEQ